MKKTWEEKKCLLTVTAFQSNVLTANLVGRSHTRKPKIVASVHGAKASLATADLNLAKDKTKTGARAQVEILPVETMEVEEREEEKEEEEPVEGIEEE